MRLRILETNSWIRCRGIAAVCFDRVLDYKRNFVGSYFGVGCRGHIALYNDLSPGCETSKHFDFYAHGK